MALNPNIILEAGKFAFPNLTETMQLRDLTRRQKVLQQRDDADYERKRQQEDSANEQQQLATGLRRQATESAAAGDLAGAENQALEAGDFDLIGHLRGFKADQRAALAAKVAAAAPVAFQAKSLPYEQRKSAIASAGTALAAAGWSPDEIAAFDPTDTNIDQLVASTQSIKDLLDRQAKENEPYTLGEGDRRFVGGKLVAEGRPKIQAFNTPEGATTTIFGASNPDALFEALIQQESGGRPGVRGPQTPYGQALGLTQVLPDTGKQMAAKLGIPWRPELMTGKTPEAAQYQKTIGRAYFDEGLEKSGGDPRAALMYYHGGPDKRLHGPKTRAYANQVLSRAGGAVTVQGAPKVDKEMRKQAVTLRKEFDALPEVRASKFNAQPCSRLIR